MKVKDKKKKILGFFPKGILGISLFSVIALSLVQLFLSNKLSVQGSDSTRTTKEIEKFTIENDILRNEIQKYSSLAKIEEYALNSGMIKQTQVQFVKSGRSVALKP